MCACAQPRQQRLRASSLQLTAYTTLLQVLLLYGTLYELLVWIYGSTSGTWRYGLDWTQPRPAGVYLLIPVVCALMFCAVWAAAAAREVAGRRLAAQRGGMAPD